MSDDELLAARDQAWLEWTDYEYTEYRPRFYKHRIRGSLHFINPFASMEEYRACRHRLASLAARYYQLNNEAHDRGLPRLAKHQLWIEEKTPDGVRYRRTE